MQSFQTPQILPGFPSVLKSLWIAASSSQPYGLGWLLDALQALKGIFLPAAVTGGGGQQENLVLTCWKPGPECVPHFSEMGCSLTVRVERQGCLWYTKGWNKPTCGQPGPLEAKWAGLHEVGSFILSIHYLCHRWKLLKFFSSYFSLISLRDVSLLICGQFDTCFASLHGNSVKEKREFFPWILTTASVYSLTSFLFQFSP